MELPLLRYTVTMPDHSEIDLFAVQSACRLEDYLTAEAFEARIFACLPALQRARANASGPGIVVFPENIGLFLVGQGAGPELLACKTSEEAFQQLGRRYLKDVLWAMVRYRVRNPRTAVWLARATVVRDTMIRTFSRLALESQMYVVAGSAYLPRNKFGVVLRPFAPRDRHVYNLSYTFGPDGRLVAASPKVNLVPDLEEGIGLSRGKAQEIAPVDVGGARLATAICYDAFRCAHASRETGFTPLLPIMDSKAVNIVAQPAANPWPWEDKWPFGGEGDTRLRKEQWLGEGSFSQLPSLQKVQYVVNPQLVGTLFDLHFDGRSAIYAHEGRQATILAEAASIDRDELVHARVPLHKASPAFMSQ